MSKIELVVNCPHCNNLVIIEELNCRIFRHAYLKSDNKQIDPHTSKHQCEYLINNNLIYGCGKPFFINALNKSEICDYI